MEWLEEYGRLIRNGIIGLVMAIAAFQAWRVKRKEQMTQDVIDAFDLVGLYRKIYSRDFNAEEGISQGAYESAARHSEAGYRIQMGGYLQQYFSYSQMLSATDQRKRNVIYEAEDILPGMIKTAKEKAAENIKQIKASLGSGSVDIESSRRRRRRR